jgi:hypothetical protein
MVETAVGYLGSEIALAQARELYEELRARRKNGQVPTLGQPDSQSSSALTVKELVDPFLVR